MEEISYHAPPVLSAFLDSNAFVRLVVGPVGSGKSSACNIELLRRAAEQRPGPDGLRRSRWAVIRNTYSQLRDTTRKTFEQWVPAGLGKWHEQSFTFELNFNDVRAEVMFRALDRPEDKKKLLSLELTGAYINEAREMPKEVFDVLQSRVGRYPSRREGSPSWFGVWMDTNPMHTGHWLYKLFKSKARPNRFEIFEQPDGLSQDAENVENLPPGYYELLCEGKDSEWIDEYVRSVYPKRDKGSVYGDAIGELEAAGAVSAFDCHTDGVFTSWDLGISDATAIWWWRVSGAGVDVLDHYESSGKPISHFFDIIEVRAALHGWKHLKHFLPHDARARTLVTGATPLDQALEVLGRSAVTITPHLSLEDGIGAGRWLLEQPIRFHSRCERGIEALRAYRYEWDEDTKAFSRKPVHDSTSHTADAFRYMACVVKVAKLLNVAAPVTKKPFAVPMSNSYSLEDLYEVHGGKGRSRV